MYDNNDSKCFLTGRRRQRLVTLLKQKQMDNKSIVEFLEMDRDEAIGYYELYLADDDTDLDDFYYLVSDNQSYLEDNDDTGFHRQLPCEIKDCICYDKDNRFCKSYCMDVSSLKLYDVMNCKGDEAYLRQGFAAMKEDF